jgi:hypothetical protein
MCLLVTGYGSQGKTADGRCRLLTGEVVNGGLNVCEDSVRRMRKDQACP